MVARTTDDLGQTNKPPSGLKYGFVDAHILSRTSLTTGPLPSLGLATALLRPIETSIAAPTNSLQYMRIRTGPGPSHGSLLPFEVSRFTPSMSTLSGHLTDRMRMGPQYSLRTPACTHTLALQLAAHAILSWSRSFPASPHHVPCSCPADLPREHGDEAQSSPTGVNRVYPMSRRRPFLEASFCPDPGLVSRNRVRAYVHRHRTHSPPVTPH